MRNAGKIVIVAAAALALAACDNGQEPSSFPPGGGPTYPAPEPAGASAASSAAPSSAASSGARPSTQQRECTVDEIKVTGAPGAKPSVTIPADCAAPTKLLTKDLTPGNGAEAKAGSNVAVNYDLLTWSDKKDVENSFDSGQPLPVTLGQGQVIPGFDQGLAGIKQGGRRLLVIPPDLGYGANANGPIKANETLVFVVDAAQIQG